MHPILILALGACGGDKKDPADDTAPPEICNEAIAYEGGAAFEDRTAEWGLSDVHGLRLTAADIDQDGYPDLVVRELDSFGRDDFVDGTRYHYVLMNRPDDAGGRTFVDETVSSGLYAPRNEDPTLVGRAGQTLIFADVDNDGDTDAFSGHFYDRNSDDDEPGDRSEILLNQGDGTFTLGPVLDEITGRNGMALGGATFTDVNADGNIDLFVVGWYKRYGYLSSEQDQLFLGDGTGAFTLATEQAGLTMQSSSSIDDWIDGVSTRPGEGATACDLDGDAMPDLLVANYARSWNQQWMNQGDGSFIDQGIQSGYAGDDDLDYSDNQFYRCYCEVYGCDPDPGSATLGGCDTYASYWNVGWDDTPSRLNGNTFTTACVDVDNDGDNDLISADLVHWHIGGSADPSQLLLNDGAGNFTRADNDANGMARDWPSSSWNAGDLHVSFLDFDNDGWQDILMSASDYPDNRFFLWRQIAPGQFEEVAEAAGVDHPWPAHLVIADFDRDGDEDIATGSSTARSGTPWETHEIHLYENTLGPGNTLRVRLHGTEANAMGVGARVSVTAGGITQTQELQGGFGNGGVQNETVLRFGLGEACEVDEVTVTWPGGAMDQWTGLRGNYQVLLTQGGAVEYEEPGE